MANPSLRQIQWSMWPPLVRGLPHRFDNGDAFKGFQARCDQCDTPLAQEGIHGVLTPLSGNRCVLHAKGQCAHCGYLNDYEYLLIARRPLVAIPLDALNDDLGLHPTKPYQ